MKIKLDENTTTELVPVLTSLGHDVHTTREEGLTGKPDAEVWSAVQSEQRFLITQDMDFSDLRRYVPGTHHGILLLRLQSPSQQLIVARVAELFSEEHPETWIRFFVVATETRVRIVRP
jgi:predicted nuclease of predicted toxin-antitoxin system